MQQRLGFVALIAGLVAACTYSNAPPGPIPICGPDRAAISVVDTASVIADESSFYWGAVDPIPAGVYPVTDTVDSFVRLAMTSPLPDAALAAANAANSVYSPTKCATATANGNVTTFVLNGCTGVFGLGGASGIVTATYAVNAQGQLEVDLAGMNVSVGRATLEIQSTAIVTLSADQKTKMVNATANGGGTGPNQTNVTRTGTYNLTWTVGSRCPTLNANLETTSQSVGTGSTQLANYTRCQGGCPQTGALTANYSGNVFAMSFDGTSTASCANSVGGVTLFGLNC